MTNRFYSLESHFGTAQNSSDLAGALLVDVDGRATAAPRAVPRAGGAVAAADAAPAPRAVAAAPAPAPAGRGAVARGGRAVAAGGDAVARAHAAARTAAVVVVAVVEKISAQISRPRMSRALKSKIKNNVKCSLFIHSTVIVMVGVAEDHRGEHS